MIGEQMLRSCCALYTSPPLQASSTCCICRSLLPTGSNPGYDIVILSDLLHFHDSHDALVLSMKLLLSKTPDSIAYISVRPLAVMHSTTSPAQMRNFVTDRLENTPSRTYAPTLSQRSKKTDSRLKKFSYRMVVKKKNG